MTDNEIIRVLDGDGLVEYLGNLYEYIGEDGENHYFHNVNDLMDYIIVSDKALRNSTQFFFTEMD